MTTMASQITSLTVGLLNLLFRRRSKKTSKLRVTGLCAGNSPETGEFPAQRASNAGNVSIWWRHHVFPASTDGTLRTWDVENIKELKVIDLQEEESGVAPSHIPFMSLVNGDKWVACFSIVLLSLYDLESGLYLKSFDIQIDRDGDFLKRKYVSNTDFTDPSHKSNDALDK